MMSYDNQPALFVTFMHIVILFTTVRDEDNFRFRFIRLMILLKNPGRLGDSWEGLRDRQLVRHPQKHCFHSCMRHCSGLWSHWGIEAILRTIKWGWSSSRSFNFLADWMWMGLHWEVPGIHLSDRYLRGSVRHSHLSPCFRSLFSTATADPLHRHQGCLSFSTLPSIAQRDLR